MILDRAVRRRVEEFLRHEQGDESHHLQVGLERLELGQNLRVLVGRRLMDRELGGERRLLQRVGLGALFLRRHVDGDDLLAAFEQRLQHGLAERLLAVNNDTHKATSQNIPRSCPRRRASSKHRRLSDYWVPAFAGTTALITYAAFSFFSGALNAPEFLISAISAALKPSTVFKISSVCSPRSGERFTSEIESDSLIGLPTVRYLPRVG